MKGGQGHSFLQHSVEEEEKKHLSLFASLQKKKERGPFGSIMGGGEGSHLFGEKRERGKGRHKYSAVSRIKGGEGGEKLW